MVQKKLFKKSSENVWHDDNFNVSLLSMLEKRLRNREQSWSLKTEQMYNTIKRQFFYNKTRFIMN